MRELGRTRVGGYMQSISFQLNPSSIYPQSIQLNSVQPNSSVNPFSSMHPFNSFGSIHLNTCIHFDSFTSTQFIPAQSVRLNPPSTRFISMPCHVVFSALLVGGWGLAVASTGIIGPGTHAHTDPDSEATQSSRLSTALCGECTHPSAAVLLWLLWSLHSCCPSMPSVHPCHEVLYMCTGMASAGSGAAAPSSQRWNGSQWRSYWHVGGVRGSIVARRTHDNCTALHRVAPRCTALCQLSALLHSLATAIIANQYTSRITRKGRRICRGQCDLPIHRPYGWRINESSDRYMRGRPCKSVGLAGLRFRLGTIQLSGPSFFSSPFSFFLLFLSPPAVYDEGEVDRGEK